MAEIAKGILSKDDERYPELLKEIFDPPEKLYYQGNLDLLNAPHLLAVVGSRAITPYGRQVLKTFIPPLVHHGVIIVSGLAYGVDSVAHRETLNANGSPLVVLPAGLDYIYPRGHRHFAAEILKANGLLITENPPKTEVAPWSFPKRNRIVAGLCKVTLVVEAQEQSGSLITARHALEANRTVFAVPGSIFVPQQKGTNAIIAQGAFPALKPEDLFEALGIKTSENDQKTISQDLFGSPEEFEIFQHLSQPRSLSELSGQLSFSPQDLSQKISLLELKGLITQTDGMKYMRT